MAPGIILGVIESMAVRVASQRMIMSNGIMITAIVFVLCPFTITNMNVRNSIRG